MKVTRRETVLIIRALECYSDMARACRESQVNKYIGHKHPIAAPEFWANEFENTKDLICKIRTELERKKQNVSQTN